MRARVGYISADGSIRKYEKRYTHPKYEFEYEYMKTLADFTSASVTFYGVSAFVLSK